MTAGKGVNGDCSHPILFIYPKSSTESTHFKHCRNTLSTVRAHELKFYIISSKHRLGTSGLCMTQDPYTTISPDPQAISHPWIQTPVACQQQDNLSS